MPTSGSAMSAVYRQAHLDKLTCLYDNSRHPGIRRSTVPLARAGVHRSGLAQSGSVGICTWRLTLQPGLESPEPHTLDRDEVFMVTGGAIRLSPFAETIS